MRATIHDVALVAKVSIKTVSRVLNDERYVREDTRQRVRAAVAQLNFHPSAAARLLGGGRSYQIGFICDNPNPYYVFELQMGIRDRAAQDGVRVLAQPYDRDTDGLTAEIGALIHATRVDGLILTPPVTDRRDVLDLLVGSSIPVVRVQPGSDHHLTPAVAIDNVAAARAMTEHLIARGHRRIGFIGGPDAFKVSGERRTGYEAALKAAGFPIDPALIAQGDFGVAAGSAGGALLIDAEATAIFAASDAMAAGVLAEAHRRGMTLPRDLSVCGFDDSSLASSVWPPLTTVRQPLRDIGWHAADLLLTTDPDQPHRTLPFEIIERASTMHR
ncbi:LacI family DNA-binding transcriptional regulator [Sphingomonas antarctica]|uniref:LacI family DNA-binding transcriptional regulator n=1 Tax=Sphingomonas antarctica TaxID=2040274 RepID=UPI0039E9D6C5